MLFFHRNWQGDGKHSAAIVVYSQFSMVFFNDGVADRETKPRSFSWFFSCEKRVENFCDYMVWNSRPVVSNCNCISRFVEM